MSRYTLRQNGTVVGTYPGATDSEALDAFAADHKNPDGSSVYANFAALCGAVGLTRDDFKAEKVKE